MNKCLLFLLASCVSATSLFAVKQLGDKVKSCKGITFDGKERDVATIAGVKKVYFMLNLGDEDDTEFLVDFDAIKEDVKNGNALVLIFRQASCGKNVAQFLQEECQEWVDEEVEEGDDVFSKITWVALSDKEALKAFDVPVSCIGRGFAPYILELDENNVITSVDGVDL